MQHDQMRVKSVEKYNENPDNYIMNDDMIASKDSNNSPFTYGDIMQGKFNTQIKRIRVIH